MKYKLKIDLGFPAYEGKKIIPKGKVFEVFMVKEVRDKVIVYCKTEDENWEMYLETLKFFAEEYYEPQKRRLCPTCKHQKKCMEMANKTNDSKIRTTTKGVGKWK